ncbi:hypothetical protein Nmel_017631 [Mimus melanotis]
MKRVRGACLGWETCGAPWGCLGWFCAPPAGRGCSLPVPERCRVCFQYEACKLNSQEVVEEDKRLKLPPNWEAKKARLEWELQVQEKKKVKNSQSRISPPDPCVLINS